MEKDKVKGRKRKANEPKLEVNVAKIRTKADALFIKEYAKRTTDINDNRTVSELCRDIGISQNTYYKYKNTPEIMEQVSLVQKDCKDLLWGIGQRGQVLQKLVNQNIGGDVEEQKIALKALQIMNEMDDKISKNPGVAVQINNNTINQGSIMKSAFELLQQKHTK